MRKTPEYLEEADRNMAFKDDLTGLFNRRLLIHIFRNFWHDLARKNGFLSLLILDLDGFKAVNDLHGHLAGDAVLCDVAGILKKTFRSSDIVIRYGGDEFVVVLPGASASEAESFGKRARTELENVNVGPAAGSSRNGPVLSFSIGVAAFPEDGLSGFDILQQADKRLYGEKKDRRPGSAALRRKRLRRLAPAAAGLVLVLSLAAVYMRSLPRNPDKASGTPPAEVFTDDARLVERENILLAEIERLRNELAAREVRAESPDRPPVPPAVDAEVLSLLKARLDELEGELDREREAGPPSPDGPPPVEDISMTRLPDGIVNPVGSEPIPAEPETASDIQPVLLSFDPPAYPRAARLFRREATVELKLRVGTDGRVLDAEVIGAPAGFGLDEAARAAGMKAVFQAGMRDGSPAVMETRLAVNFRFRDRR